MFVSSVFRRSLFVIVLSGLVCTSCSSGDTPTAPDVAGPRFTTLPVGAVLPTDAECASQVRPTAEIRKDNAKPNATRGQGGNTLYPRVTGDFVGTTDEVLQWAACKWGVDEDLVRAQIAKESYWHMSSVGDNGESFGLGQVRLPYHDTAFVNDNAKVSSAYNVDYTYAFWRGCFEGRFPWLNDVDHVGTYAAGDAEGCLGVWFSGRWYTKPAKEYIEAVTAYRQDHVWTTGDFRKG